MKHFDYKQAAREAGISARELDRIVQELRRDFAGDEMMVELHALRACLAVRDGRVTVADVLGRRAA